MQSIRERAAVALAKEEEETKSVKHQREHFARVELDGWLRAFLGVTLAEFEAEGIIAELAWNYERKGLKPQTGKNYGRRCLRIYGACPTCGKKTWSRDILDWDDLGLVLEKFTPPHWHSCLYTEWSRRENDGTNDT